MRLPSGDQSGGQLNCELPFVKLCRWLPSASATKTSAVSGPVWRKNAIRLPSGDQAMPPSALGSVPRLLPRQIPPPSGFKPESETPGEIVNESIGACATGAAEA